MNQRITSLLLLLSCCFFSVASQAQLLPPNQPEQNACDAILLCGNTFTSPYGYQGIGTISDLTMSPCGGGEGNSMWIRLEITTPGIIVFTIAPLTITDDYDMAVLDITNSSCSTLTSANVIRCNFNTNLPTFNNGITGLNTTSTSNFTGSGVTGGSYLQQINASAGDVYLIMINNFGTGFGGPLSGFTIDFTGSTAIFNQSPNPKFDGFVNACDYSQEAIVQLSEYVLCSSIAADGSDFSISPSGSIQSVQGLNCTGTNGYTNKVKITFAGTLPDGNYTLHAEMGTDGNTLLGLCNAPLLLPDSINFHVGNDPIHILSIDAPACQFLKIHLNSPVLCNSIATDGSDFVITGPSNVPIASASAQGCVNGFTQTVLVNVANPIAIDGNYLLKAKIGSDANTMVDTCGRIVPVGEAIGFTINSFNGQVQALPDTSVCNTAAVINLHGTNSGTPPAGGFQYQWTPTTGVANPNSLNTTALVQNILSHYVLETIDINGCYLRDSNTVKVQPLNAKIRPKETIACLGDNIPLTASGGTNYQWYDNPGLSGTPTDLSCNLCAEPTAAGPVGDNKYFVIVKNDIGCQDTLSTIVHVQPVPLLNVQPKDTLIRYGESVLLKASGAQAFSWYPMGTLNAPFSSTPLATPKETTVYTVTGSDQYGCVGYDSAVVRLNYRNPVLLPNSFTPNNDGLNDVFNLSGIKFQKLLAFKIFDRYGRIVFETNNPEKGWDGQIKGKPANPGVYNYYIKLGHPDNEIEVFKGNITLIR